ncbi:MAG: TonB-dependent receptor plug domain-containing protein [Saprospiraceae bacterium]
MSKIFFTLLFLFVLQLAQSQMLSGLVTDIDGKPLPFAIVFLTADRSIHAECDEFGKFTLRVTDKDSISVSCNLVGFESQEVTITDSAVPLHIVLSQTAHQISTIEISANRVKEEGPFTRKDISAKELQSMDVSVDLPYLLQSTPSMIATSDAGAGIGYTSMRLRGSDQTRINVTINGMPLNEPESHQVFWVDLPDLVNSVSSIQIQRGVGPSTNGTGAFGGTVSIDLSNIESKPAFRSQMTYGSFNTKKLTVQGSTGLIQNKFGFNGRLSVIKSDGYVDRAYSNLLSGNLAAMYLWEKSSLRFQWLSGGEKTYQSWWGVPQSVVDNDLKAKTTHYYNNLGSIYETTLDSINLFSSGRTYNYYTYDNQIDRFNQNHAQIMYTLSPSPNSTFKSMVYYRKGSGYYEQQKFNQDGTEYASLFEGNQDLVRRRWISNDVIGVALDYTRGLKNFNVMEVGLHANKYFGNHFGRLVSIDGEIVGNDVENQDYYFNDADKIDISSFIRLEKSFKKWKFSGDAQWRFVDYSIVGSDNDLIQISELYTKQFFNPKMGISYKINDKSLWYGSVAVAQKEPSRSDLIDSHQLAKPKHETLIDYEMGYKLETAKMKADINAYYMQYFDQLVLTGALNDVGASLRQNVDRSYRLGIESSALFALYKTIQFSYNIGLSTNKIAEFKEIIYDYTNGYDVVAVTYKNTDISFSPNIVTSGAIHYKPMQNLHFQWQWTYVGKQFLDNTSRYERVLPAYQFQNASLTWSPRLIAGSRISFGLHIMNIWNALYSSNGYTYSYIYGDTITENFLYPQAGRHGYLTLSVEF